MGHGPGAGKRGRITSGCTRRWPRLFLVLEVWPPKVSHEPLDGQDTVKVTDLECVLWDFGNTLAQEALWHPSEELPTWPVAFEPVFAIHGDDWNAGRITDAEFTNFMAERLDVPAEIVRSDLEQRCASIAFFEESLRVVQACPLPQAVVTVNPQLFSELIVPRYPIFERFEFIVTSWEEGSLDKAELCSVALSRFKAAFAPSAALLIDNVSENVRSWEQRGGQGYVFRGGNAINSDLSGELAHLGRVCGISGRKD